MKIIDEKGRVFRKINIIDFLVILFLLCLMPAFYFGYKIMTKKPVVIEEPKKEFVEIETNCRLIKLRPEVLKIISVGDKELDENGEAIGKIISLGQSAPYKYELDIGKGQKITKQDSILKQVEANLKLKAEVKQDNIYYKDKVIKIGLPLEFETNKYSLMGIPLGEEEEIEIEIEDGIIDLYVTLKDLDEDTLKEISVGDKEVDETGETIAEILSLGKIEENSFDFILGSGNFVTGKDSAKRQISTKMRLKFQIKDIKDGKQLFFKGKEIKYNNPFEFKTDRYKVAVRVAKTFEVISPIKEKWILLQVKFSGVRPEIASIVQKGDVEKDAFEKTVGRISSVISNRASEVLTLKKDEFITLSHPFNKDILASLNVQCTEKEGVYYFKNFPVKMGNNITFVADLYSLTGVIVGMEIK